MTTLTLSAETIRYLAALIAMDEGEHCSDDVLADLHENFPL